jgi:DNA processing protein
VKLKMCLCIDSNNEHYSESLSEIKNPPKKLYYKGNIDLLNEPAIAVVGSRKLTNYGKIFEKKIVRQLALRNIVIVSGMAIRSR